MIRLDVQKKIWARIEKRIELGDYTKCDDSIFVHNLRLSPDGVGYLTIDEWSKVYQPEFITQMISKIFKEKELYE